MRRTSPSRGRPWHPARPSSGCAECHSQTKSGVVLTPGAPDSVRFQGTTLTWSRCYKEGDHSLDCVTCHDPHRNAETSARWYESRCLQCHPSDGTAASRAGKPTSPADSDHRTSCPIQPASGCIECHMPKRATPMAHTRFTDHYIRIHRRD